MRRYSVMIVSVRTSLFRRGNCDCVCVTNIRVRGAEMRRRDDRQDSIDDKAKQRQHGKQPDVARNRAREWMSCCRDFLDEHQPFMMLMF